MEPRLDGTEVALVNVGPARLPRRLGTGDAIVIGLGSMIGAGVFAAIGPAAAVAGPSLMAGLVVAGVVAFCNATSSARLAAVHPDAGGTYVYGREHLGPFWGYLASWGFVVGKTASCAAMALTFASYIAPGTSRPAAVAAVVALTAVNWRGVRKTLALTTVILAVVLASLAAVVVAALAGTEPELAHLRPFATGGTLGVLRAAGLLFFAFAGYARVATLGEEVIDPARTIPRAVPISLWLALAVYALVALAALVAVGAGELAGSGAPLVAVVGAGRLGWLAPTVRVGAAVASLGVLLSLLAGISRTVLAMAREDDLPAGLAALHPRHRSPHRAVAAVGVVVGAVALAADLRPAIGFSSFAVLAYYGITNVSAWRLTRTGRHGRGGLALVGLLGCVVLAFSLPPESVAWGTGVLAAGTVVWLLRHR